MAILPPIKTPIYWLHKFWWCQIEFVFTHELLRLHPQMSEVDAYKEAREVAKVLKDSGQPLSLGAEPDEVNWEQLICAANAYSHMQDQDRAQVRSAFAQGAKPWAILATLSEPDMCELKVLDDPDYNPEPGCIPKEASSAAAIGGACFLWAIGVMFTYRAFADRY
jgi:hypothetical protein